MAEQQQKRKFSSDEPQPEQTKMDVGAKTTTNLPFAWWSDMADLQKEFLQTMVKTGSRATDALDQQEDKSMADIGRSATTASTQAAELGQAWLMTAAEQQRELANFMRDRLAKDQAFLTTAIAVSNVQQLMQLQASWLAQATQDYSAEFGKLASIARNGAKTASS